LARKILLADDSVTAQNMGRKILADAGYEVITVNNGSAALKKISEQKPDLIVLDVYMPGYSGLEVCQRVKESRDIARTPVLLTVGTLEPGDLIVLLGGHTGRDGLHGATMSSETLDREAVAALAPIHI